MKWFVTLQFVIYFLVSPFIVNLEYNRYDYSLFLISFVALASLFIGFFFGSQSSTYSKRVECHPKINRLIVFVIVLWALFYVYISIDLGIVQRRQGTYNMAELFSQIPLLSLITLRTYEILFYPVVIFLIYSLYHQKTIRAFDFVLIFSLFLSFLASGVVDSKLKLIIPIIVFFIFLPNWIRNDLIKRNKHIFVSITILIFLAFVGLVFNRYMSIEGANFSLFFLKDFIYRVDGIQFLSMLAETGRTSPLGTYDNNMFMFLIAKIPFLEVSNELKMLGLTSSKAYLLNEVLFMDKVDHNNTMITDLYYYGGYLFLFAGVSLYGFFIQRLDQHIQSGYLLENRVRAAFYISFGLTTLFIERDFFGMSIDILRNFILILGLLFFVKLSKVYFSKKD